jgi:hypothetical protein
MPNTFTPPYPQTINNVAGQILPADTTTKKTIYTAGSNGSILKSLGATSTDTSSRIVIFYINVGGGGTDEPIGAVTIAITAGTDGVTAALDCLRSALMAWTSFDAFGNKVLYLKASTTLKVACTTTVTTAKELDFNGEVLEF